MNQDPVRVSRIEWLQVLPQLRLVASASVGLGPVMLLLAAACVAAGHGGSQMIAAATGRIDSREEHRSEDFRRHRSSAAGDVFVPRPALNSWFRKPWFSLLPIPVNILHRTVIHVFRPESGRHRTTAAGTITSPLLLIWNIVVLSCFGTALTRTAALKICRRSPIGPITAVKFARSQYRAPVAAAGLIAAVLLCIRGALWAADVLASWEPVGRTMVQLNHGFVVLTAAVLWLTVLVGGVAWLLSLSAGGTDRCRGAEGLSRSLSYILSHRLWTASALLMVAVIAALCRSLTQLILLVTSHWTPPGLKNLPSTIITRFWDTIFQFLPDVVHLSVFLAGMTILYVLLRQKEDGVGLEETDGAVVVN